MSPSEAVAVTSPFTWVCLHMDSSLSWMCPLHPWTYCASRINYLAEHKGASISYKSIYFLSCAEIIPEHYLTAPEGPSEERLLEARCGNYSDSIELLPGLFLIVFLTWTETRLWTGRILLLATAWPWSLWLASAAFLVPVLTQIHRERRQAGVERLPKCPTSSLPILTAK